MPSLASRFDRLPPYPLADVPVIRRELRAKGVDVIDLGAGDADLAPPPAAVRAIAEATADAGMSRYPFQLGLPAFREAIAAWMRKRFAVELDPYQEILPLIGSKEGIAHLAFCYVEAGTTTIVPDPGYQAYLGGTVLAGGEPYLVPLRPEHDFLVPLDAFPDDVVRRARILYLNYPNNPTAASAPNAYLEEVVAFCREHDIVLAYDNAYSEIAFNGYRPASILQIEGARDVAIEFHSLSKTYNMTGWRIGWAAGSRTLVSALSRAKTFVDTGVFLGVQAAGQACLESYDDWVPGNVAQFQERRDALARALSAQGFDVTVPDATMYLWVPVPDGASEPFARRALVEQGVVIMPGAALGAGGEGFFRVALTQPASRLVEAAERLGQLL
ncbi:MAG: aminotransferase class I/II-fold pyridoxal phosphate-dependent enzyme [Gemmatimonadota bacterium]|jgi:LL-diaminopimelate aminotransferase